MKKGFDEMSPTVHGGARSNRDEREIESVLFTLLEKANLMHNRQLGKGTLADNASTLVQVLLRYQSKGVQSGIYADLLDKLSWSADDLFAAMFNLSIWIKQGLGIEIQFKSGKALQRYKDLAARVQGSTGVSRTGLTDGAKALWRVLSQHSREVITVASLGAHLGVRYEDLEALASELDHVLAWSEVDRSLRSVLQDSHVAEAARLVQSGTLKPVSGMSDLGGNIYNALASLSSAGASVSGLMRALGVRNPELLETGLRSLLWSGMRVTLHEDGSVGPARRGGKAGLTAPAKKKAMGREERFALEKQFLASLSLQEWQALVARMGPSHVSTLTKLAQQGDLSESR